MTALHQRGWQLRTKWWQITHTHVLANGKKKGVWLLFIISGLPFHYSLPPSLHYNYYFPLWVPGHRVWWAFPSPHRGLNETQWGGWGVPQHGGRHLFEYIASTDMTSYTTWIKEDNKLMVIMSNFTVTITATVIENLKKKQKKTKRSIFRFVAWGEAAQTLWRTMFNIFLTTEMYLSIQDRCRNHLTSTPVKLKVIIALWLKN